MIDCDKLQFDDYDWEYGAYLDGKPYTGKAFSIEHGIYSEYSYLNGDADGKWLEKILATNVVILEGYYEKGNRVKTHRQWNKDGILLHESEYENYDLVTEKAYYVNGVVKKLYINDKSETKYYEDGSLYVERIFPSLDENWYSTDGTVLVTRTEYNRKTASYDNCEINYDWLIENAHLLERVKHKMILRFILWNAREAINKKITDTLYVFLAHKEPYFRHSAIYTLGECNVKEAIPLIEPFTLDTTIPNFSDYEDNFVGTEEFSIANTAKKALEKLRK